MWRNCNTMTQGYPQVPWGKHTPLHWRGKHFAPSLVKANVSAVLPLVLVKDPLAWMKSMCRNQYNCHFRHGHTDASCPSPVNATKAECSFPKFPHYYESLMHLW